MLKKRTCGEATGACVALMLSSSSPACCCASNKNNKQKEGRNAPALVGSTAADSSATDFAGDAGSGSEDATVKFCSCSDTFNAESSAAGTEGTLSNFISSAGRSRCNQPLNLELSVDGISLRMIVKKGETLPQTCCTFFQTATCLQYRYEACALEKNWVIRQDHQWNPQ